MGVCEEGSYLMVLVGLCDPLDYCRRDRVVQHQLSLVTVHEEPPSNFVLSCTIEQLSNWCCCRWNHLDIVLGDSYRLSEWEEVASGVLHRHHGHLHFGDDTCREQESYQPSFNGYDLWSLLLGGNSVCLSGNLFRMVQ